MWNNAHNIYDWIVQSLIWLSLIVESLVLLSKYKMTIKLKKGNLKKKREKQSM